MYEKVLRMYNNFILAASKAEDPFMKAKWTYMAENMKSLLKLYSNYQVCEVEK